MKPIPQLAAAVALALTALSAGAQSAPVDHSQHQAAGGAETSKTPGATPVPMAAMDKHMQAMKALREKIAAAQTPEERRALMAEHMKVMREGMAMMEGMKASHGMGAMPMPEGMHAHHAMMEKRLDMMESMMRMMMDRLP